MTDDAREKDAETIEGVLAMARHGRNDPAATLDAVVSALAALRTETSKPLGHEEEVDQWMYHVGPIPEGFTVEPVGIRTDGAGEQLDARVPLREALAVIARDVMPDEIADEVEEHVYRALAECGEVDAHEWLKRRGAGDLAQCEATNDGCRCQWRAGHDGMHTDGILFWDDEDSDAPAPGGEPETDRNEDWDDVPDALEMLRPQGGKTSHRWLAFEKVRRFVNLHLSRTETSPEVGLTRDSVAGVLLRFRDAAYMAGLSKSALPEGEPYLDEIMGLRTPSESTGDVEAHIRVLMNAAYQLEVVDSWLRSRTPESVEGSE